MRDGTTRTLRGFESLLLVFGLLLLLAFAAALVQRQLSARAELKQFWSAREAAASQGESAVSPLPAAGRPDFRLWSEKRIAAYNQGLANGAPAALAVLRIPSIHVEVPVLEGSDDATLDRAVGHIESTAEPGEGGNVGIAGHRDGFFRALKDVHMGDEIELVTQRDEEHYRVDGIEIVTPSDVSVLRPREKTSVTLVTCYPFYFVGSAPQRFIVHASLEESTQAARNP